MYATANYYLGLDNFPQSSLRKTRVEPVHMNTPYYQPVQGQRETRENFKPVSPGTFPEPSPESQPIPANIPGQRPSETAIDMKWKTANVPTTDPKVWGPAFWFSLHTSAAHYPENPSQIVRERMKQRILAIPYEVPCSTCRPHASAFIESYRDKLDKVVSNKHELGKFYVDFHNKVNKRYNKPEWTYDQAYKVYSGQAKISYLT